MLKLAFNIVGSCTEKIPQATSATWKEFRNQVLSRIHGGYVRSVKDGPAWIPVTLKDQSQGRNQSNVDTLNCIVLDVDHGMTFDAAAKLIKEWGYEAALHTSYSHTPEAHRFRVIMPLATPLAATEATPLFVLMQATFDNKLDPACLEPSRLFYLPSCAKGNEQHYRYEHIQGKLLSLPDAVPSPKDKCFVGATTGISTVTPPVTRSSFAKVACGNRHTELTKIVGKLLSKGIANELAMAECVNWNASLDEPLPVREVERTVKDICLKHQDKAAEVQTEWDKVVEVMNRKYAWLDKPMALYRIDEGAVVSSPSLAMKYANRRVAINVDGAEKNVTHFDAWLKSPNRREHDDLTFRPGLPEVVENCVNLWKSWGAEPAAGDIAPWVQLLDFIFGAGTPERVWIEQWFAYPLQNPGAKLKTCVVIWSTQHGIGKSMLGETVGKLYGKHSKTIGAKELHSNFNGWAQETLFVMGEENSSGDHRADSNKLKELITGDSVFIEEKYQASTSRPNQMNFLFTSNHPDAFHLETADRRYFVWSVDEKPLHGAFYDAFIGWRESSSGLPALMAHLLAVDMIGFQPHGHAPMTAAKLEMKEMSKTELERWITDAISDASIDERFGSEVMATQELARIFKCDTGSTRGSDTALTKALRRQIPYVKCRINLGKGKKVSVVSLRNHKHWKDQPDCEWIKEFNKYSPTKVE
jgi:hypothetical protein